MLSANPRTSDWLQFRSMKTQLADAMNGLTILGASELNLTREISFARVGGKDLSKILGSMRGLVSRSSEFTFLLRF